MSETLKLIFEILVIIELVVAEASITIWVMRKKSNVAAIIISDIILTIGFILLIIFVLSKKEGYGDGGGSYLFLGAIYIIPPLIFSKMKIKDNIIIITTGFMYGLLVYAVSLRITYFFDLEYLPMIMFIVQTIIHTVIWIFFFLLKQKYEKKVFPVLNERIKTRALIVTVLSFLLIISFNSNLTRETSNFQKLWAVVLLSSFVVFSLLLIFELWGESIETEKLSKEVKVDKLTGIKNRLSFKIDINDLISKQRKFSLIYMDLDKFKTINDTYGHLVGDQYLIAFSKILNSYENELQKAYRLSGDEFCFITEDKKSIEEILEHIKEINKLDDIDFLGFSYGIADYPKDGDDANLLLQHSDLKMYHMKKGK